MLKFTGRKIDRTDFSITCRDQGFSQSITSRLHDFQTTIEEVVGRVAGRQGRLASIQEEWMQEKEGKKIVHVK